MIFQKHLIASQELTFVAEYVISYGIGIKKGIV